MKIEQHTVVSLTYNLYVNDDKNTEKSFVESATEEHPLVFLYGAGGMIPDFENNLAGLGANDTYSFSISAENGYGEYDESAVVGLNTEMFGDQLPKEGEVLPLKDQHGNEFRGKVLAVANDVVKVDLNHPMAGKNLHFDGKILSVRIATETEIEHGHVHGPDGHHHH